MRRTAVLVTVGLVLTVCGAAMVWGGTADGPAGLTVGGILVLIAGLACLRIAYWTVRVRAMTRAGLALQVRQGRDRDE
jgi:hypothetical protein